MPKQWHLYGNYPDFYIPAKYRYPQYRIKGPYQGFDPMDYCRELRRRVTNGEISWDFANALWREYADSVDMIYYEMPKLGPCALSEPRPQFVLSRSRAPGAVAQTYPVWGT